MNMKGNCHGAFHSTVQKACYMVYFGVVTTFTIVLYHLWKHSDFGAIHITSTQIAAEPTHDENSNIDISTNVNNNTVSFQLSKNNSAQNTNNTATNTVINFIVNLTRNKYFNYAFYDEIKTQHLHFLHRNFQIDQHMLDDYFGLNNTIYNGTNKMVDEIILSQQYDNGILVNNEFTYHIEYCYIYCGIYKVATSNVKQLLIYLTRHKKVYDSKLAHDPHLKNKVENISQFYHLMQDKNKHCYNKMITFTVLRDPLKRLLSGFLNKCIFYTFEVTMRVCTNLYSILYSKGIGIHSMSNDDNLNKNKKNDKKRILDTYFNETTMKVIDNLKKNDTFIKIAFENWIEILSNNKNMKMQYITNKPSTVSKKQNEWVNQHWMPQIYWCQLYKFIHLFDYIVIYDKFTLTNNIEYILTQMLSYYSIPTKNMRLNKVKEMVYNITHIELEWNNIINGNDAMREQNDELSLLNTYYTKDLSLKALKLYFLDYRYLPLKPPLWIGDLE